MKIDFVILSPISPEYQAIRLKLKDLSTIRDPATSILYEVGTFIGKNHSYQVAIQQTGPQNDVIALATERVIRFFCPKVILLVGIAGGLKDVNEGDIVIGTKAIGYQVSKITKEGRLPRSDVAPYSFELIELAKSIVHKDKNVLVTSQGTFNIIFGPIVSGDQVITDKDNSVFKYIKENYENAKALDMEGIGFAKALFPYPNIRGINIRSISDLIDNKKEADERGSQKRASENAAEFAFQMIDHIDIDKLKIPFIELQTLVHQLLNQIIPVLKTSNTVNSSTHDLSTGLFDKLMHLIPDELTELQNEPDDADIQATFRHKLKKALIGKELDQQQLFGLLLRKEATGDIYFNENIKNAIIGKNKIEAKGDIIIGDTHS